jgi:hypothetical protein
MVSIVILYYNIIIFWDQCRIWGPTLTETSLCSVYRAAGMAQSVYGPKNRSSILMRGKMTLFQGSSQRLHPYPKYARLVVAARPWSRPLSHFLLVSSWRMQATTNTFLLYLFIVWYIIKWRQLFPPLLTRKPAVFLLQVGNCFTL